MWCIYMCVSASVHVYVYIRMNICICVHMNVCICTYYFPTLIAFLYFLFSL